MEKVCGQTLEGKATTLGCGMKIPDVYTTLSYKETKVILCMSCWDKAEDPGDS